MLRWALVQGAEFGSKYQSGVKFWRICSIEALIYIGCHSGGKFDDPNMLSTLLGLDGALSCAFAVPSLTGHSLIGPRQMSSWKTDNPREVEEISDTLPTDYAYL